MFSFSIIRKPYLPNPVLLQASEMKERILDLGGRFFKFVINGCSTMQTLEQYLILEYGLNRVVVEDAIARMLVTTNENIDGSVMDIWLIDETNNGVRDDCFAGYAFTEAELDVKTQLFLQGIQEMKSYLEKFAQQHVSEGASAEAVWTL